MRLVSLDFETTGTVRGIPSEPWQLGLVEIEDGEPVPGSAWETLFRVDEGRPFSPRAPGRWASMRPELAAAPSAAELWPELSARLCGRPLVAHNAPTERTALERLAPLTPFGPWVDTLKLLRKFWPAMESYALGDAIRTFGLQAKVDGLCAGRTWHDALYDACAGAVLCCHVMKMLNARNHEDLCRYA